MTISGFTIVKDAVKFNYPVKEAILSILPICDEFIVNVGESTDGTLEAVRSIPSSKIKIIESKWDESLGEEMLSQATNAALRECRGDWAFYIQTDEVVHERDLPRLKNCMHKYLKDEKIEGFRFKWLHFYGSFYRYRVDPPWFQKQDRIVRNQPGIEAYSGAWGFRKKDGSPLKTLKTPCFIYHYGWVNAPEMMSKRRKNAQGLGYARLSSREKQPAYDYGDLSRFPVYFGTLPKVMKDIAGAHGLSRRDFSRIKKNYWWSPLLWFRVRYKTFLRPKEAVPV